MSRAYSKAALGLLVTLAACVSEPVVGGPQGPEPTVWIGLAEDVEADGQVSWAYPAYYAHTQRPDRIWGYGTWETSAFSSGASDLFEREGYGADLLGEAAPEDLVGQRAVFNAVGDLLHAAFGHAKTLGVKTALGTELPLGREPKGPEVGYDWVRGMPPELQARLRERGLDPADPAVVQSIYEGIFTRIMRTHELDYYWLWSWEVWSLNGVSRKQVRAMKEDMRLAQAALEAVDAPFELALAGWILGTANNPAAFDDTLPAQIPFLGLWDEADGFESLSAAREKWPATWLEEDWGLSQPQLEMRRVYNDARAAQAKGCQGFIAKHWRTRMLSANTYALSEASWVRGTSVEPPSPSQALPARATWIEARYNEWATRWFGAEVGAQAGAIFASLDNAGEAGEGALPRVLEWDTEDYDNSSAAPGAIVYNEDETRPWPEQRAANYAFVDAFAALRPDVRGAANLERFDYWLAAFEILRAMGEYADLRRRFETTMDEEQFAAALALREEMARVWEQIMTREVETVVNVSDLGEIINQELLNWHQLMQLQWDETLRAGLGGELPASANPSPDYVGAPRVVVTPARTQAYADESLTLVARVVGPVSALTVHLRPLGGDSYESLAMSLRGRGVYELELPPRSEDFEYYVEAATQEGPSVVFPASAPEINHTVVVLPR